MRLSLISPGDIDFHFCEMLDISKEDFNKQLDEIAKILAKDDVELILSPDKGTNFELTKRYKHHKGKKAIGIVPMKDKDFGIEHLNATMDAELNGKKIFDEFIDADNWFKKDLCYCTFGDAILMLGISLGTLREISAGFYLYKLFMGQKDGVKVLQKKIHKDIRAGESFPFSVIVYKPFLKELLPFELEKYIEKTGGRCSI